MSGPMQWTGGGFVPAVGVIPNAGETKGGFVPSDQFEDEPAPAVVVVERRVIKAAPKPTGPMNVVAMAKARLREVKSEIRRLKALEKEKGELERLIAAAESKPKPNIREIKRPTG